MTDKSDQIAAAIIERVTGEKPMTQKGLEMTRRGTTQEIADLRVGDILWSFDSNRRVYSKPGFSSGGPIYRQHYQQEIIVGETSLSWLVGEPATKVNKKTLACRTEYGFGGYFTKSAMENRIWINENRPALIRALEYSHDADLLRAVDRLVKNAIS